MIDQDSTWKEVLAHYANEHGVEPPPDLPEGWWLVSVSRVVPEGTRNLGAAVVEAVDVGAAEENAQALLPADLRDGEVTCLVMPAGDEEVDLGAGWHGRAELEAKGWPILLH